MSLLHGPVMLDTRGNAFFHCDKEKGGCGHISQYANTELVHTSASPKIGPISRDVAEWVATYCENCGKPVSMT